MNLKTIENDLPMTLLPGRSLSISLRSCLVIPRMFSTISGFTIPSVSSSSTNFEQYLSHSLQYEN